LRSSSRWSNLEIAKEPVDYDPFKDDTDQDVDQFGIATKPVDYNPFEEQPETRSAAGSIGAGLAHGGLGILESAGTNRNSL